MLVFVKSGYVDKAADLNQAGLELDGSDIYKLTLPTSEPKQGTRVSIMR